MEHRAIILKYNEIIRGYLNYYCFVDNYKQVAIIVNYILAHSCAKTLARKLNLPSRAAVFQKFARGLAPRDEITGI